MGLGHGELLALLLITLARADALAHDDPMLSARMSS